MFKHPQSSRHCTSYLICIALAYYMKYGVHGMSFLATDPICCWVDANLPICVYVWVEFHLNQQVKHNGEIEDCENFIRSLASHTSAWLRGYFAGIMLYWCERERNFRGGLCFLLSLEAAWTAVTAVGACTRCQRTPVSGCKEREIHSSTKINAVPATSSCLHVLRSNGIYSGNLGSVVSHYSTCIKWYSFNLLLV